MQLQLLDADGKLICELDNDDAPLGSYPVQDGFRLHVSSGFVAGGLTRAGRGTPLFM